MFNLHSAVKNAETAVKKAPSAEKEYERKRQAGLLKFSTDIAQWDRVKLKFRDMKSKIQESSDADFVKAQRIADLEAKELELMTKIINRAQNAGIAVS
jgi:hypothetical protein